MDIFNLNTKDQNVFFTSDTHFCHENIIRYCNRPFVNADEMNKNIINNWNNVVKENDVVFHLGDFAFGGAAEITQLLSRLNGKIVLVMGNHDYKSVQNSVKSKFYAVYNKLRLKINGQRIILNHEPLLCFEGSYKCPGGTWQLFGHVHSGPNDNTGLDHRRLINLFPTQYDVGVDNNSFTPISFDEVKQIIDEQVLSQNLYRGTK